MGNRGHRFHGWYDRRTGLAGRSQADRENAYDHQFKGLVLVVLVVVLMSLVL